MVLYFYLNKIVSSSNHWIDTSRSSAQVNKTMLKKLYNQQKHALIYSVNAN